MTSRGDLPGIMVYIHGETSANGRTFQLVKWDFNGFESCIEWGFSVDGKNWKVES